jgi:hypothetical protein
MFRTLFPSIIRSSRLHIQQQVYYKQILLDSSWNVMAHVDTREGKWRGNWRMDWVASTLHTTSEHGVSSITTAHAHTSAASSRLNWLPLRFKWTRPLRRKKKSCFCACAITFQLASNYLLAGMRWNEFHLFPASKQLAVYGWHILCCCMYSLKLLMMDGKTVRNI